MTEQQRFLVRFWGVRGSYPTPGAHTTRYGGNTACVEVQVGTHLLIFDAGSGIIRLGEHIAQKAHMFSSITLFISHGHSDHLLGLPFFSPLFDPATHLHIIGPDLSGHSIEQLITPIISPPYFPVDIRTLPSKLTFHTITALDAIHWYIDQSSPSISQYPYGTEQVPEICVKVQHTHMHPSNGTMFYRIECAGRSLVYATDVEWKQGCDKHFLRFIDQADILIHDAQYTEKDYQHTKRGYGHSTVEMAIEAALNSNVKQLLLFHHDPHYDDDQLDAMEGKARHQFAATTSAYEGMEIDLLAS